MRPVRLVMQGFGAYRDRTEVDFEGVELFALSGPTGAGKSTVVDAICMALYGTVPRYADQRMVAPSISQGLNEALVQLDFLVGGVAFTAVRVVRRTKKGATTKEARLESGGEVLAGNERELTQRVTELLGLTFEHFTRCVVLPQGEFARFLHDKPGERQELLKQLLDIRVYEQVAQAAKGRAAVARGRAEALVARLGDLAGATPERRQILVAEAAAAHDLHRVIARDEALIAEHRARIEALEGEQADLGAALARLRSIQAPPQVGEIAAEAERAAATLAAADAHAEEARRAAERAMDARSALGDDLPFQQARRAHDRIRAVGAATPERLAELRERHADLVDRARRAREAETLAEAARSRSEVAARQAAELRQRVERLAGVEMPAAVPASADRLAAAAEAVTAGEQAVVAADSEVSRAQADRADAGDVATWVRHERDVEALTQAEAEQRRAEAELAAAEQSLAAADAAADRAASIATAAEERWRQHWEHHQAAALRAHLTEGAPCPVCEQVVKHVPAPQLPLGPDDDTVTDDALDAARREAREAAAAAADARGRLAAAEQTVSRAVDVVARSRVQLVGLTPSLVEAGRARAEAAGARVESAVGALEVARANLDQARTIAAQADSSVAQLRHQLSETRGALAAWDPPAVGGLDLMADWQALVHWARGAADSARAAAQAADAEAATALAESERRAGEALAAAGEAGLVSMGEDLPSTTLATAAASVSAEVGHVEAQLAERQAVEADLSRLVTEAGLADASEDAVDSALARFAAADAAVAEAQGAFASAAAQVSAGRQALESVQTAVDALRRALNARFSELAALGAPPVTGFDVASDWAALVAWAEAEGQRTQLSLGALAAQRDEVVAEVKRLEEAVAEQARAPGLSDRNGAPWSHAAVAAAHRADAAVARLDEQRELAGQLETELAAARQDAAVGEELARLLRADQFERWLLDDVMGQLVAGATERLKELSSGAYSLMYADGEFWVVDHRNADQVRQARTLSGGETFLASLALALSLADQLAAFASGSAARLDALFLDEGFGTLDADTLDVVASAIEELGARGRMVGVISHVAELAERVPVRYEVRKVANASHIERVWR